MKKQLIILGITTILFTAGLSGCEKQNTLTPANIIIQNVTYSPSNPLTNEEITFTVTLENTGDKDDFSIITLNGNDRNTEKFTIQSGSFIIDGHSQKNVTISTAGHIINEGIQSFEIGITGNQTIRTINIDIQPGPPEIYYLDCIVNINGTRINKTTFTAGEVVNVYYRYRNVNHEGEVDTYHNITVYHEEILYYSDHAEYKIHADNETFHAILPFYVEGNWPLGEYQIEIRIQDNITKLTSAKTIYFTVV